MLPAVRWVSICVAVMVTGALAPPAISHPHVWVSVETAVIYEAATVVGLRQRWLFDEFYSSMAIQGLDANGDGVWDRSELAELAKVNIEGLREFNYFTFAKIGDHPLNFGEPTDVFMEHVETTYLPGQQFWQPSSNDEQAQREASRSFWSELTGALIGAAAPEKPQVVALEFTLPLEQPVLAEAEGFNFATYDPSFFIWFELATDDPITLTGKAPGTCKVHITSPRQDTSQLQQLGEAAFDQDIGINISFSYARTVSVSCPE